MLKYVVFFFFNDTATTEIYTLSLHDALPIFEQSVNGEVGVTPDRARVMAVVLAGQRVVPEHLGRVLGPGQAPDRKSTRLNSSHANISYAVFCLKKKKTHKLLLYTH